MKGNVILVRMFLISFSLFQELFSADQGVLGKRPRVEVSVSLNRRNNIAPVVKKTKVEIRKTLFERLIQSIIDGEDHVERYCSAGGIDLLIQKDKTYDLTPYMVAQQTGNMPAMTAIRREFEKLL